MRAIVLVSECVMAVLVGCLAACGGHSATAAGPDAGLAADASLVVVDAVTMAVTPIIVPCPGCTAFPSLGAGSPSACTGTGANPQLVYPPDQVLLPPNMNVIEVQFQPGAGNTLFEIDFENAVTDVRIETPCNAVTNTRGSATGGCAFTLDPTDWADVASLDRGGDPVTVTVRGVPSDLSCVAGSNSRSIAFAQEDLAGGIYYWQSVTQGGIAGKTGGIFRKDFGNPDPTPEPFLTPGDQNKCVGCHYLSRDGLKMVFGSDDADSDDELGDDHFVLYDVTTRAASNMNLDPGFAAWHADDHASFFISDGQGKLMAPILVAVDGTSGQTSAGPSFMNVPALANQRITNPDWSRDGATVYFTATTPITGIMGYPQKDDIHAMNGSIWSVPVTNGTFGAPSELVTPASTDENDYYPAISPDGTALVFDRAVGTTLETHDSYNNVNATLYAMTVPSGKPVALARANYKDAMTNSWPRWSPFVQSYKGKHILWITFSSTRDYGLRVQNENPPTGATFNCYPPVSPEDPSGDHTKPFDPNCTQPQIWMAAISLEDLAAGNDPSFPAFWLPFQDYTAHNHIAQWVDQVVAPPTGCAQSGASCASQMCCAGESCDPTTQMCESLIP